MNTINKKDTKKASKKFTWDQVLNALPKKTHDLIVSTILPKLTGKRYATINSWRNIKNSQSQDMPVVPFLVMCKFFNLDPFEAINIQLPETTIKDLEVETEEEFADALGLIQGK